MVMSEKKIKNIFLSSIHQNAGKTMVSLGLFSVLQKRRLKTAFLKPIGQQFINVGDFKVDKDSFLIGKVFHCGNKLKKMSPVTIGRGYTERYIFNPHKLRIGKSIAGAFDSLAKGKDAIIVEGTGHAGVGSVIDYSNADVAKLLGSKVIIISGGGIGKSIDEIVLNKALFDLKGVEIIGVIVNKVLPDKYAKIKRTLGQGLKNKGIKLLGVIPLRPLLSSPTVEQVRNRLNLKLLCGKQSTGRRIRHTIVAAMEPHNMINYLKDGALVLTSGDRVDNILVTVSSDLVEGERGIKGIRVSGIILTGGLMPNPKIVDLLKKSKIPVLLTDDDTYSITSRVEHLVPKILQTDKDKILEAERLVNKNVDIETILKSFK